MNRKVECWHSAGIISVLVFLGLWLLFGAGLFLAIPLVVLVVATLGYVISKSQTISNQTIFNNTVYNYSKNRNVTFKSFKTDYFLEQENQCLINSLMLVKTNALGRLSAREVGRNLMRLAKRYNLDSSVVREYYRL